MNIVLVRIVTTVLPLLKSPGKTLSALEKRHYAEIGGLSYEDFSVAQANRRSLTSRVVTTCARRNSGRVGTLRARDLPRVLHSCERTRQSGADVRKCERRSRSG